MPPKPETPAVVPGLRQLRRAGVRFAVTLGEAIEITITAATKHHLAPAQRTWLEAHRAALRMWLTWEAVEVSQYHALRCPQCDAVDWLTPLPPGKALALEHALRAGEADAQASQPLCITCHPALEPPTEEQSHGNPSAVPPTQKRRARRTARAETERELYVR